MMIMELDHATGFLFDAVCRDGSTEVEAREY
jgi:hypothetical protein